MDKIKIGIVIGPEGGFSNKEEEFLKKVDEDIYYKTITYMYRWNAKIGLLLYPISNSNSIAINEHHILETDGCVVKVGFPIPEFNGTFFDFSEMMRISEGSYLEQCKKYIIANRC